MYTKNICLFVPYRGETDGLYTARFVLETAQSADTTLRTAATVRACYVCEGSGQLHSVGRVRPRGVGDLFFTFEGELFAIENVNGLKYMYISFLGGRGNQLLDRLGINRHNRLFHRMNRVGQFWETALGMQVEMTDVITESALLYAFSCIEQQQTASPNRDGGTVARIRQALEDGFSRSELSLETLASELAYNKKYLSSLFKKTTGVGVVEYLQSLRIQHACAMMEQGFTAVADIASHCGFDDPQYFSKVFKRHLGLTPTQYIRQREK